MPLEDWPICTTMGTIGSEADWHSLHWIEKASKLDCTPWGGQVGDLRIG